MTVATAARTTVLSAPRTTSLAGAALSTAVGAALSWAARAALSVAAGAAVTVAVDRALDRLGPARRPGGWRRTNFRGRTVSLGGGVAAALGSAVAATALVPPRLRPATALIAGAAALAGAYDDLVAPNTELAGDKGWHGHLGALRAGRPSGGVVKVGVIGAAATLGARSSTGSWSAAVPAAALIAGAANLVNLFDLRPGRAGKVVVVLAASQLGGPGGALAGAVAGAALAELPGDLGERRMLGDVGANTLGALLGLRLAANGAPARWTALGVVAALTAASERVSFTEVIARRPLLRRLDEWGREPVARPTADTAPPPSLPR